MDHWILPGMMYHSDFWVSIAAIGPVLALTHAVALERAIGWFRDLMRAIDREPAPSRMMRWIGVAPSVPQELPKGSGDLPPLRHVPRVLVFTLMLFAQHIIAVMGFVLSGLVAKLALDCMAREADRHSVSLSADLTVGIFGLLIAQVLAAAVARSVGGHLERGWAIRRQLDVPTA